MKAGGDISKVIKDRCGTVAGRAKQQCEQEVRGAHQIACGGVSNADKSICLDRFVKVEQGLYAVQDANRRLSKRQKNSLTVQSYAENRDAFAKIGRKIFSDEVKRTKNINKLIDEIIKIVPEESKTKVKKSLKELKELGEVPGTDKAEYIRLLLDFLTQAHEKLGGEPAKLADLFENREIQNVVREAGRTATHQFEFGEQREKISLKEIREYLLSKAGGYCVFEKDSTAQKNCEAFQKSPEQSFVPTYAKEERKKEVEDYLKEVVKQFRNSRTGLRGLMNEEKFWLDRVGLKTNATQAVPATKRKDAIAILSAKDIPNYQLRVLWSPWATKGGLAPFGDNNKGVDGYERASDSLRGSPENITIELERNFNRESDSHWSLVTSLGITRIMRNGMGTQLGEPAPWKAEIALIVEKHKRIQDRLDLLFGAGVTYAPAGLQSGEFLQGKRGTSTTGYTGAVARVGGAYSYNKYFDFLFFLEGFGNLTPGRKNLEGDFKGDDAKDAAALGIEPNQGYLGGYGAAVMIGISAKPEARRAFKK